MGFILDGLEAESYDRSYSDRQLLARIRHYFRDHVAVMAGVATLIVLHSLMGIVLPLVVARAVQATTPGAALGTLWLLPGLFLLSGALSWAFNYFRQWQTAKVVGDVVLALRQDVFAAIMRRDLSFYDQHPSGSIVSRVTSDTEDFSNVVTLTLNLISQLLQVLILSAILFAINARLALIALAIAPVILLVALSFRNLARRIIQRSQRARSRVNTNVQETLSGISVAKNFRQEQAIYDEFRTINTQVYHANLRTGFVYNGIFPLLITIAGVGSAAILYAGGGSVLDGTVDAGEWFLFVQSINMFWFPLTSIASFWSQFQQGLSASERVFALVDAEPEVVQTDAEPVGELEGAISFRAVDFRYRSGEPVLQGFALEIPAGQKLAVVGHTGAGKSSLARLITRFYEFQGGELLIDGRDIRSLDLAQYRRRLGFVPQTPFLFSGSVADNIRYGAPGADDAALREAALKIGGGEWLQDLPEGLETDVGERGARLSLGQRQLVALARVLVQNPSIFILDEATASVDPFTEAQIQEALDVVMRGRTSIIIAHRLSTVQSADRIVVMRSGTIIEEGSHDQLLALGGHYAELYNTYFRHQSLEYIEQVGQYGE